ncbi:protein of unknown function [Azospirillum baldaniorum]|uniref:Uncharacterized protein n=1 Tax=Azospirillum baldaniorum TaxID=1064539 RepID=A0A9P1JQJ8_9PROT|nr:protein of unknown function [Azospirillum baldaniorum]
MCVWSSPTTPCAPSPTRRFSVRPARAACVRSWSRSCSTRCSICRACRGWKASSSTRRWSRGAPSRFTSTPSAAGSSRHRVPEFVTADQHRIRGRAPLGALCRFRLLQASRAPFGPRNGPAGMSHRHTELGFWPLKGGYGCATLEKVPVFDPCAHPPRRGSSQAHPGLTASQ